MIQWCSQPQTPCRTVLPPAPLSRGELKSRCFWQPDLISIRPAPNAATRVSALYFIFNNFHLQMGDSARRIQVFGAYLLAVKDRVTAPYTMLVVYNRQTLLLCAVSRMGYKP